jgi:hypothetical protein
MRSPAVFRLSFGRLVLLALSIAEGSISRTEALGGPPSASPAPFASIGPRADFIPLLRELDRFLDHHPLIESDLRVDPSLLENQGYLKKNPALHQFLLTNPELGAALQTVPRHFLHRALRREANVPIKWSEVAQLDAFLDQHPAIEQQLVRRPALILKPDFLAAETQLREFLVQHDALARGFLPTRPAS